MNASCGVKRGDGSAVSFLGKSFPYETREPSLCFYRFVHFGTYSFTICRGFYI